MNQLNVVIAQLQLVVAILAAEGEDSKNPDILALLSKAKSGAASAIRITPGKCAIICHLGPDGSLVRLIAVFVSDIRTW